MAEISAKDVQALRVQTGVSMMECKKALVEANGNADEAVKILREKGIAVETDIMGRSLKSQMKYADKIGASYTCIIGKDEVDKGSATLKNMKTSEQSERSFEELLNFMEQI